MIRMHTNEGSESRASVLSFVSIRGIRGPHASARKATWESGGVVQRPMSGSNGSVPLTRAAEFASDSIMARTVAR
jgi:hypothetical protein